MKGCSLLGRSPLFGVSVNREFTVAHPVKVVTGMSRPYGTAFNSRAEMIVSEWWGHEMTVFDIRGQRIRTIVSHDSPEQMKFPKGIAIDDMDNIYVSSNHNLQKFTSSGALVKCVGQEGGFNFPRGVILYNNEVYVCDSNNHRIQVFDLDLNFIQSIGSHGKRRGEFDASCESIMYIDDYGNARVQVVDKSGHFVRVFAEGKLRGPTALHIVDKCVYVSDHIGQCIVVSNTSGQFVTSFGKLGHKEGQFKCPRCITSCADSSYMYVIRITTEFRYSDRFCLCSYYLLLFYICCTLGSNIHNM